MIGTVNVEMAPVQIVLETCYKCGVVFGMTQAVHAHARNHGSEFFCTAGHGQVYREPEVKRLARELAQKDQELARQKGLTQREREAAENARAEAAAAERRVTAQKAVVTRLKNKAAKGECPCCGKLFADLCEHMKSEHPEFEQREEPAENPQ